jgi:uncharacterized short protein YbdD (DUF466 family)
MDKLILAWRQLRQTLGQTGRLAVGVPDYDAYVSHLREHHPGRTPPTYAEFFRERQDARYGRGRVRCC